ncbi:MAG: choline dehydrogenase, partial [Chromatiales bacterium]|nr:choline dehydrogenase [Chromatiales bacterium]
RGTDGPLHVQRGARTNPLYQAFVKAGIQAGYVATDDYNGAQQEGFGAMEMTVSGGRRWSAANAYLRPALKRPEVRLISRALVHKVTIEGGRAVGVEYQQGTKRLEIRARREVILSASSINSPKLLMLSGIGPQLHLRELGIPVHADRRGVGANLMDHLELYIQQACTQPISLYSQLGLVSKARIGLQWLLFKSGLGATNHFEACAFIRSQAGIRYPDIQYHFLPVAIRYDGTAPAEGHGFQAHVGPMRASSRGTVRLRSAESNAPPKIIFNYLETLQDREAFRTCIKLTRELFRQAAFDPYRGAELAPGPEVVDDEALDAYAREHVESAYHPCGTCKMGAATDPDAVVDSECCVIGVDQLRVADSSIFPRIPNGNLNGPSIMVGEKASDHILGVRPLAPSNLEPWFHPHWQTEQR